MHKYVHDLALVTEDKMQDIQRPVTLNISCCHF